MRFGRILITAVLIVAAWYGYKYLIREYKITEIDRYENYIRAIAQTSVAAELYRNQPDSFIVIRDSILSDYGFTTDSIFAFRKRLSENHEEWIKVWERISALTDTLADIQIERLKSDTLPDSTHP